MAPAAAALVPGPLGLSPAVETRLDGAGGTVGDGAGDDAEHGLERAREMLGAMAPGESNGNRRDGSGVAAAGAGTAGSAAGVSGGAGAAAAAKAVTPAAEEAADPPATPAPAAATPVAAKAAPPVTTAAPALATNAMRPPPARDPFDKNFLRRGCLCEPRLKNLFSFPNLVFERAG